MFKFLKRLIGDKPIREFRGEPAVPPRPDEPFIAIGDLHGRADLLVELEQIITNDYRNWPLVFLGDYIDRGEDSRQVLSHLMSATSKRPECVTCLMGNHEKMLLNFLDDPAQHARRWLRSGGLQTLASFGVSLPAENPADSGRHSLLRDRLTEAMGEETVEWIRSLPLIWRSGNVWAVHAGASPNTPMEDQTADALLWGHPQFLQLARADDQWVTHGHTIVDQPTVAQSRISVDTAAYATGILSAAVITSDGVVFIQTGRQCDTM